MAGTELSASILAVVLLAVIWIGFLALRYRVSYLHMILAFLSVQALAVLYNSLDKGNFGPTYLMLAAVGMLVAGMAVHRVVAGAARRPSNGHRLETPYPRAYLAVITTFALIVFALVVYHYVVGGIPLFSTSIETLRFEVARSGLLGIPSRMHAFGTLFVLFLLGSYWQRVARRPKYAKRLLLLLYGLTAISLLFSGFKSSLIVLVEVIVILNTYVPSWRARERLSVRSLALYTGIALAAVFVIAAVYAMYRDVDTDIIARVVERIFYISGQAFYFVVDEFVPSRGTTNGQLFYLDIQYLLGQLGVLDRYLEYTGGQVISGALHGRSPFTEFVVPTTMNIFGTLYVEWGILGLFAGAFVTGAGVSWLYYRPFSARTIVGQACLLYFQLAALVVITRGNLGYAVGNRLAALAFLILLLLMVTALVYTGIGEVRRGFFTGRLLEVRLAPRSPAGQPPVR